MPKKYLTTSQAATICNVTRFTIRNWINSGRLKSSKTAGGHRRICQDDLTNFMESNQIVEIKKPEITRQNGRTKSASNTIINRKKIITNIISTKYGVAKKSILHKGFYHTGKCMGVIKNLLSKKKGAAHDVKR